MTSLETAESGKPLKRVAIDPVSRVEGHGKVTLLVDDDNRIQQVRLHIVEFRGFEKFIQGRPYWEVPVLVQRLCGICPVSHHLAAGKAVDQLVGAPQLTESAEKIRRLLQFGQVMQSHALHFFHLASPDLLFGFESDIQRRNIVGVIGSQKEIALKGIQLRRFGQQVLELISGKRIHGTLCLPGGVNKALSAADKAPLLSQTADMLQLAEEAVDLARALFLKNESYHRDFASIRSNFMGMIGPQGALELYHGNLRLIDANGQKIEDQFDYCRYNDILLEEVKSWTYMKFPHYKALGADNGWYRVGPLARLNVCDFIASPRAEARRQQYFSDFGGTPVHAALAFHWARMIELLHC
ncbi:MAG TPA: Ni/Fe hydrogenase subunit alpha, partial [Pseudomonadales bacterium]|nr:Ni/Fe hydrogenase subunit alpha [Pseudomonadales bacterium]